MSLVRAVAVLERSARKRESECDCTIRGRKNAILARSENSESIRQIVFNSDSSQTISLDRRLSVSFETYLCRRKVCESTKGRRIRISESEQKPRELRRKVTAKRVQSKPREVLRRSDNTRQTQKPNKAQHSTAGARLSDISRRVRSFILFSRRECAKTFC